jgi:hypothetical protein
MAASPPCFYEPVVIRRTLIFRPVLLLLKLSPSLEALLLQLFPSPKKSSFQNLFLSKLKSGVGCNASLYFRAALVAKSASACAELSG